MLNRLSAEIYAGKVWVFSLQIKMLHFWQNIWLTICNSSISVLVNNESKLSQKIIYWYFLGFLWSFTRKTPENLKKQSVSIIFSIFVKKISPNNVRDFFFLLFIREKKICLWTLWNFSWPSATRNFKIGFTRKCSSH